MKLINKYKYLSLIIFLLLILLSKPLFSQWAILYRDVDSLILLGADKIYNLEFNEAEKYFKEVQQKYPQHPAGYFLDAIIEWWKIVLNNDDISNDDLFYKKIDKVIDVCNRTLDTNSYDINALFFKGGAIGYRARLKTMRDEWISAIKDAKEALDILQKCQQLAPFNHDIMLGTGIYNYFAVKFPEEYPLLKPLMLFLPSGDKRLGLFQLRAASKYARYASVEAKVVLLQIYYSFENNNYEALQLSQELHNKYPNNAYFHRYLGRCLVRMGMSFEYEKEWREVFSRAIERKTGYNSIAAREATYYIGVALMNKGDLDNALKYFQKSLEGSQVIDKKPSGFYIAALMKIGNIYDLKGNRNQAKNIYNKILSLPEWNDSHKTAANYLNNPFKN